MKITVLGGPATKGSMRCIGARGGRGRHTLIPDNKPEAVAWHSKVMSGGRKAVDKYGPLSGPLVVDLTFTVHRPPSVPLSKRPWPITRSSGDSDKLLRAVLDALDDAGLYGDDSQIVMAGVAKAYPDTPGAVDRLPRPGVVIRIETLQ